jgi:hypothetical protein
MVYDFLWDEIILRYCVVVRLETYDWLEGVAGS